LFSLHSLTATFVPRLIGVISEFSNKYRHMEGHRIAIQTGTLNDILEQAGAENRKDLFLTYSSDEREIIFPEPELKNKLDSLSLVTDQLTLVSHKGMADTYEDLLTSSGNRIRIPYISYTPGTYLNNVIQHIFGGQDFYARLEKQIEVPLSETMRNAVRHDLGIGWIMRSTAKNAFERGEIREINPAKFSIPIDIKLFRWHSTVGDMVLSKADEVDNDISFAQEIWQLFDVNTYAKNKLSELTQE